MGVRRAAAPKLPDLPAGERERRRFIAARARQGLLAQIVAEQRARRAHEALDRVVDGNRTPAIVGAFYASWQETGVASLRANADHLTNLFPAWLRLSENGDGLDT